jgi:hypothetical protein
MPDKRYQVFISSTFSDLQGERREIWQRLIDLNFIVAGMESFPASSQTPFEYIKPLIETSDYFLLILGARYGSMPEGASISYTEMEFDYATSLGIPILVFLPTPEKVSDATKADRDEAKFALLSSLIQKASAGRMVTHWRDVESLSSAVVQAVVFEERRNPQTGWVRNPEISIQELLIQNRSLSEKIADLEVVLGGHETLNDEEMRVALQTNISFTSSWMDEEENILSNVTTLADIMSLEPVFEDLSYESIRGTLSVISSIDHQLDRDIDPLISDIDADTTVLALRRFKIIEFDIQATKESLRRGPNWLLAHDVARREVRKARKTGK